VIGFDINPKRVAELQAAKTTRWMQPHRELKEAEAAALQLRAGDLKQAQVFIVTVPTPVDQANRPT
jgi:UDP-N-acetyl-D-galactosamine dehydrogenase